MREAGRVFGVLSFAERQGEVLGVSNDDDPV
jgi:hypothetical protein